MADEPHVGNDILEMAGIFSSLESPVRKGLIKAVKNIRLIRSTGHGTITIDVKDKKVLVTTTVTELFRE